MWYPRFLLLGDANHSNPYHLEAECSEMGITKIYFITHDSLNINLVKQV